MEKEDDGRSGAKMTEADFAYLRNIDTRPCPNAGQQQATKTEFELDEGLHEHAFPSPATSPGPQDVRFKLRDLLWHLIDDARYMRNVAEYEYMSGELAEKYAEKIAALAPSPAPSLEPQDVREAVASVLRRYGIAKSSAEHVAAQVLAALAQSKRYVNSQPF